MNTDNKLAALEEQIKVYLAHIFLEKKISDDQSLIDDMIERINIALKEVKLLKTIQ